MFLSDNDVTAWKTELQQFDHQRKTAHQDPQRYQFSKPVTWRDVKQKEVEYHPILQKFSQEGKENTQQLRETSDWKHKAELQRKNVEKYLPEYNIINLEKDSTVPSRFEPNTTKPRLMPSAQVDYNIITNSKLDDFHFQNVKLNVANKRKYEKKVDRGPQKDYNIISNMYLADNESRSQNDRAKVDSELQDKYNKTHNFNLLVGEFYDKQKETDYQEQRIKDQQDHGRRAIDKLPPTVKNRETIIFDPTREVPDAIKKLDQKKKDAMKKYELRYKVEDQMRERDIQDQTKNEQMRLNRINDKKFTEHLDKGFDIITMDNYDQSQLKYAPKPTQTKWEKLRLNSNPTVPGQQFTRVQTEKPALTSNDLKNVISEEKGRFTDTGIRPASLNTYNNSIRSAGSNLVRSATKTDQDFSQTKEFKSAVQRAKEPAYNLADKYNQYCVPPQKVVDDFNTRTLPQVQIADTSLKFGMTKTGAFKRGDAS